MPVWMYVRKNNGQPQHTLNILLEDSYVGKSVICQCAYDNSVVVGSWSLVSGSSYASMNNNGKITINEGVQEQSIVVLCTYNGMSVEKTIEVTYDNQLTIECASTMTGTIGNAIVTYNSSVVQPVWSIDEGSQYATVDSLGEVTILASGQISLTAQYNGYSCTKHVQVQYQANTTSQTTIDENGAVTTETQTIVDNPDGSTTISARLITVNEDGSQSQTTSTTIENQDGSSQTTSTTTNQDGTYSQTQSSTTAPDQSGSTTQTSTTNYNANGDPVDTINENVDVSNNVSTQNIVYDSNGNQIVAGYAIDTSRNEDGVKTFNADGVNTEFYGFNSVNGFTLDFHFTIDFTNQPTGQNQNHHNILTMKRSDPSPWYGFQLRQSGTNKTIQLGTQFSTGNNTNTGIAPNTQNWIVNNQIAEYDIQITYDPTLQSNTFVCREILSNRLVYSSSLLFPDLPELRNLTVCIGYALDQNINPYRYSKINVINFSLQKMSSQNI